MIFPVFPLNLPRKRGILLETNMCCKKKVPYDRRGFGWQILWDLWFLIDLALIFVGILALVVIPTSASKMTGFEKLLLVRGLRLLRLMRVLRMVHHFKIIWRLVSGFLTAWDTIFASAALILVTLFIFACIAIEFIAKDGELIRSLLVAVYSGRWIIHAIHAGKA